MKRAKKHHDDKKYINPDFSDIHSEGACFWLFFVFVRLVRVSLSLFFSLLDRFFFVFLSKMFTRTVGFCRLGSYTGDNTLPSSYSPSCPSQTLQSPSVTSPSDRRRPLGLCQDWVMCEQGWTKRGQKGDKGERKHWRQDGWAITSHEFSFHFDLSFFFFLWERTCCISARKREEQNWTERRSGVVTEAEGENDVWGIKSKTTKKENLK